MGGPRSDQRVALEFAELNASLHADGDWAAAMRRLVELATVSVPGCRWAGITAWPEGGRPRTVAVTGRVAASVDDLQYTIGEGPCLSAVVEDGPEHIVDMANERRWPVFCTAVTGQTPVRSALAFHLIDRPRRALNLYGARAGAFDAEAITIGTLFAAHARVLMLHADSATQAESLAVSLATSRQIGAAVGILMAVHRITEDQAFDLLRSTSQNLNRKLRDVALDVMDTGALPEPARAEHRHREGHFAHRYRLPDSDERDPRSDSGD